MTLFIVILVIFAGLISSCVVLDALFQDMVQEQQSSQVLTK